MGVPVEKSLTSFIELDYVGVKAPQFSLYAPRGCRPHAGGRDELDGEVGWPLEKASPNIHPGVPWNGKIGLVIDIPKNCQEDELTNDYIIRRKAVDFAVPLITGLRLAKRFVEGLVATRLNDLHVKSWDELRVIRALGRGNHDTWGFDGRAVGPGRKRIHSPMGTTEISCQSFGSPLSALIKWMAVASNEAGRRDRSRAMISLLRSSG